MRAVIQHAAGALIAGLAIELAVDLALQVLSAAIRIDDAGSTWWGRIDAAIQWIGPCVLVWLAAPLIAGLLEPFTAHAAVSRRTVWAVIGASLVVIPPLIVVSQIVVTSLKLTVAGAWGHEWPIFLTGSFLGNVLLFLTPWVAAGVILLAWARHMAAGD
jgi:hypothetical protein